LNFNKNISKKLAEATSSFDQGKTRGVFFSPIKGRSIKSAVAVSRGKVQSAGTLESPDEAIETNIG